MAEYINGLSHFGLFVENIEISKAFYQEILGAQIIWEHEADGLLIAFAKIGNVIIEIVQFPDPLHRPDGTFDHLAFDVSDIEKAYADLKSKGVVFESEIVTDPRIFAHGSRYVMFRGPDNERLEIFQKLS